MNLITRTPVLWTLFVLTLAITGGFVLLAPAAGGQFLDRLSDPEASRALVAGLSESQRTAHFWTTVLLDTAYPFAYGLFFAGMALRFFGRWGRLAAVPAIAVMIVDLTENTLQALTLAGAGDFLEPKAWITPLKFNLFYLAALIALVALGIAVFRMVRKPAA
jgi:hypothetical protein